MAGVHAVQPRFDANQQFQLDAIASVVELFAGAESDDPTFTSTALTDEEQIAAFTEPVYGNSLSLSTISMQQNLRRAQDRVVATLEDGREIAAIPEDLRKSFGHRESPDDFGVEMETGTGKTYVYLRTIAELNQKYGFSKFVIVVPSVAIREGVMSSLSMLKEHLRTEYDGLQFDHFVYDSNKVTQVRNYATTPSLQIMVINIQAFSSATTIMNNPSEKTGGYAPIEFLRACRPIVIMDEPQSLEGPTQVAAIASLDPLVKLRYSATHRTIPHMVYRLTPVDAYDLKLVKHINVLSVTQDHDLNEAFIEVTKITGTATDVTATATIYRSGALGTSATQVTLHKDDDLRELAGGLGVYEGWIVEHIHADLGLVEFGNGEVIPLMSSNRQQATEQLQRLMIRHAIEAHLDKESDLFQREAFGTIPAPLKPLTLFFIDRVAHYAPADGKFRIWFAEEWERARVDGRYSYLPVAEIAVDKVHDGYFATDSKGNAKDTTLGRDTKDAESAFVKIMQKKGELISPDEPLRFIFSHSALAEGWDNPNVFTICNLQDGKSEMRKRQQIGRGLRLPVMANGERSHDEGVNQLTVIANESFAMFAAALQQEIETETGVKFDKRISNKREKNAITLKEQVFSDPLFTQLWNHISEKTTYQVDYDSDSVVKDAVTRINVMPRIEPVKFRISKTDLALDRHGVDANVTTDEGSEVLEGARRIPDVVGELTRRVALSRATIVRILTACGRLDEVKVNPSVFIDQVVAAMNDALYAQVADGIVYEPTGDRWDAKLFQRLHQKESVSPRVLDVEKTITDRIAVDSGVEETFARFLEDRADVKFYLKLPGWFLVPTPLGNYNPDWAIVRQQDDGDWLYLVRETKGTAKLEDLQWEHEQFKVKFGKAHFTALHADYLFGHDPKVLIEVSYSADDYKKRTD